MSVYENDAALPAQPVPNLNVTSELIRQQIKPFCSEEAWPEVEIAALDLKAQGQLLHKGIREYAESRGGNASWLRPLIDEHHLSKRGPLPLSGNYAMQLRSESWHHDPLPALIVGLGKFLKRAAAGDLPPEEGKSGPLSMDSVAMMAYTRIPQPNQDLILQSKLSGPLRVAVVHRGHWFVMNITDASGKFASVREVGETLASIRRLTVDIPTEAVIGTMTAVDRDRALALRTRLLAFPENRVNLAAIQDSVCVVSMNDSYYGDDGSFHRDLLLGDIANRYFDKSLQIIGGPNGELGLNLERSVCDPDLWLYALEQIAAEMEDLSYIGGENIIAARHLPFYVDAGLGAELRNYQTNMAMQTAPFNATSIEYPELNLDSVVGKKCEAATFVLFALQAAYRYLTGETASVAYMCPTRNYYQGRDAVVRPVSTAAVAFAQALSDGAENERLRELFPAAQQKFEELSRHAREGNNPDLHTFGLRTMRELLTHSDGSLPLPDLFSSTPWQESVRDTMKVAGITSSLVNHLLLTPESRDGLAIGYAIGEGAMNLVATGFSDAKGSPNELLDTFDAALGKMADALLD